MNHQTWCMLAARAAAFKRARGSPDPLSGVAAITPQLLADLGVTIQEIERALVSGHKHWVWLLQHSEPELAIDINSRLSRLSRFDSLDASARAHVWLKLAASQYNQGRIARALLSAGRGVLIRSLVAGRPLKKCFERFQASPRGRPRTGPVT